MNEYPVKRIRISINEADAMDLEGILSEVKEEMIGIKIRMRERDEDFSSLSRSIRRVEFMLNQLRREMVLVGWLDEGEIPAWDVESLRSFGPG